MRKKKSSKIPLSSFCVGHLSCVSHLLLSMGPALKYDIYTQWDAIGKTNFSFARGCQLEIASYFGMGAVLPFPSQDRGSVWVGLCRPCAGCHHNLHEIAQIWNPLTHLSHIPHLEHNCSPTYPVGPVDSMQNRFRKPASCLCSQAVVTQLLQKGKLL